MKVTLQAFRQARDKSTLWLLPVFEDRLGESAREYGYDRREAQAWGFDGKLGRSQTLMVNSGKRKLLLLGAGKMSALTATTVRKIVASGVRQAGVRGTRAVSGLFLAQVLTHSGLNTGIIAEAAAEGVLLGAYAFTTLKGTGTERAELPGAPRRLIVTLQRLRQADRRRFKDGLIMAEWTTWARDLLNHSQSHVTARRLASRARAAADKLPAVRCTVLDRKQISNAGMGLLLAVNQGSSEPPQFIVLRYTGDARSSPPVCLIGKGVTFDTGGYNLKPGESMKSMQMDKGGGVAALASFFAAAQMKVRRNLVCLVPCTDNRVSGSAMVPGDVYTAGNGMTVEIDNTDAEGRLILADALAYSRKFKPAVVLDMATLTGAAVVAVGDQASALFTDDDALCSQLQEHAAAAGELVWRLPLWDEYAPKLKSFSADLRNAGGRWGGAITAALFLKRFVPDGVTWCHIDMAGKMKAETDEPCTPAGSSYGFGPMLLARWLRALR